MFLAVHGVVAMRQHCRDKPTSLAIRGSSVMLMGIT